MEYRRFLLNDFEFVLNEEEYLTQIKHEERLDLLEIDNVRNKITWAKLFGMFTASGTFGGLIVGLIMRLI